MKVKKLKPHSHSNKNAIASPSSNQSVILTRAGSEPFSKPVLSAVLSVNEQQSSDGTTSSVINHKHVLSPTANSRSAPSVNTFSDRSFLTNSAKSHSSHTHATVNGPMLDDTHQEPVQGLLGIQAQGKPVVLYKLDDVMRIKSGTSDKSQSTIRAFSAKETKELFDKNTELTLTAISCAMQQVKKTSKPTLRYNNNNSRIAEPQTSTNGLSDDSLSNKELVLSSIYAPVIQTTDRTPAHIDALQKVKKIFLSEKQSGTIRENGRDYPCAPPATPTPGIINMLL